MIRTFLLLLLMTGMILPASAQLTLEECQRKAQDNYPLVTQYQLIRLSEEYSLANAAKGNLPQISLSGKASYQSDATTLPFEVPGVSFRGMPKDQYQVMVEVRQNLWDGGIIRNRKKQISAASEEATRQLDVSMYAVNERVNEVFFGILLLDEQLTQNTLYNKELERNLKTVCSYRDNGLANEADVDAVQVEILQSHQQRISLENNRRAYIRMLSLLTGEQLEESVHLTRPDTPVLTESLQIRRPELALYNARQYQLNVREQALKAGIRPQLSLFAQGAYGNPGLNMLKDAFEPSYLVGARLSWNFGSLYTLRNDRRQLDNERLKIESNRNLFLFNTRMQLTQQDETVRTLREQMKKDDEIIRLRTHIRQAAESKVANGTLSVTEMLRELTRENLARQDKALHEIQLLLTYYQLQHLTNE